MDRTHQGALRKYLETIAPESGALESLTDEGVVLESIESADATDEEKESARAGVEHLRRREEVSDDEAFAVEAIVHPLERPVVDVENDSYGVPLAPFDHLDRGSTEVPSRRRFLTSGASNSRCTCRCRTAERGSWSVRGC